MFTEIVNGKKSSMFSFYLCGTFVNIKVQYNMPALWCYTSSNHVEDPKTVLLEKNLA